MTIQIYITGGTFDKEYNELDGSLFFRDTHLPEMLKLGRCRVDVTIEKLMMVDSLDLKDADRTWICDSCIKCPSDRIIITHGTDTMANTAQVLGSAKINKTIVMVGAMIPFKFGSSDGLFNLGSAIAFVQTLPHGVYVTMNGQYFYWDNVEKNRTIGGFQEKNRTA